MVSRNLILLGLAAAGPALAGEYAVFASGARLRADRHEIAGNKIVLYHGSGVSEVPAAAIVAFEALEEPPATPLPTPASVPALAVPAAAAHSPNATPADLIRQAAQRSGLPPEFVASVAKVESGFRQDAVSPKGAIGVMQLMPATAQALGADPRDLEQNIDAGARLLRDLLLQYDGDVVKALSAYNAGPGAVARYRGLPPYEETRRYVNKVIGAYQAATAAGD